MKPVRPWWREYNFEIVGSIALHLALVLVLGGSEGCLSGVQAPKPVTKISVVSLGSVKKSKIPDRATRAPQPKAKSTPKATAPKAPSNEMTIPTKDTPPTPPKKEKPPEKNEQPTPPEKTDEVSKDNRDELVRKLQREQLLQSLTSATVGKENREESSQEGSEETTPGLPSASPSDPILSAYIAEARSRILPNWAPLPTLIKEHPEYEVIVQVQVESDGRLLNPTVIKKSGDASFDKAAIRAIYKTGNLPPPPEKWKASAAKGILITLAAADKS